MKRPLGLTAAFALMAASPALAQNSLIVTYAENSDNVNSTLSHTAVFDFNDLAEGSLTNVLWNGVGSYDRLTVSGANQYGGAGHNGSRYALQGAGGVETTTLSFEEDHAYFGFWWSAGDSENVLSFYSEDTLVARFTTATLLHTVAGSRDYYGNPTTGTYAGQNATEPYAFVNFFGEGNTTWDRIVFSNSGGSGFESDNHTDRAETWGFYDEEKGKPLPGVLVATASGTTVTVIPEPSSMALLAGLSGLLGMRRKR